MCTHSHVPLKPLFYRHYINHTLILCPHYETDLHTFLVIIHPSINFTFEYDMISPVVNENNFSSENLTSVIYILP